MVQISFSTVLAEHSIRRSATLKKERKHEIHLFHLKYLKYEV